MSKPRRPFSVSVPYARMTGLQVLGLNASFFWHQSEARRAATVWNWSSKTLSPGALLAVIYFPFVPYFSACLDFPSPPLFAPGSLRVTHCLLSVK